MAVSVSQRARKKYRGGGAKGLSLRGRGQSEKPFLVVMRFPQPQPGDPVEVFDGGSKDTGSWKQATACGSGSDGAAVVAELDDGDDPNKREWKIWRRPVLDPDVS